MGRVSSTRKNLSLPRNYNELLELMTRLATCLPINRLNSDVLSNDEDRRTGALREIMELAQNMRVNCPQYHR